MQTARFNSIKAVRTLPGYDAYADEISLLDEANSTELINTITNLGIAVRHFSIQFVQKVHVKDSADQLRR